MLIFLVLCIDFQQLTVLSNGKSPVLFRVEGIDNFKVRNKRSASSADQEGTEGEEEDLEEEVDEEEEEKVDNETQDQGLMYSD